MSSQSAGGAPILVVDDDEDVCALVSHSLEREGFRPVVANDGLQALAIARQQRPVLVILELMIPKLDGWEVCRELRRESKVAIIFVTGRSEPHERIMGLDLGADDYVVKPVDPSELVARVRAVLRRTQPPAATVLAREDLSVDLAKRRVSLRGTELSLTVSEYTLLHVLMSSPGRTFLREELLNHLYPGGEAVVDRVVDVHIGHLRQKIEADPARPRHILTTRGVGYRFADDEDRDSTIR